MQSHIEVITAATGATNVPAVASPKEAKPARKSKATGKGKGKGRPRTKPYQKEGSNTWSFRLRLGTNDIHQSGFVTQAKAAEELGKLVTAHKERCVPLHRGPEKNTVALAMQRYGLEHLPSLKGAAQEVRRINRYLSGNEIENALKILDIPSNYFSL